jgi:multidrug efflux system membrane fusion protein
MRHDGGVKPSSIERAGRTVGLLVLISVLLGFVAVLAGCSQQPAASPGIPLGSVPVAVARVGLRSVPVEVRGIGNVEAFSTVSVKAQVAGTIEQAFFREGQDIKKGDLLFKLDERPFRATLQQLEANLARNRAELENAKAQSERYARLYEAGIVSKEQYDSFRTNADALAAAVRADQAAIERARIDLEYCTILSPIDGRSGSLMFHPGNIVKSNETVLVVINQVNPIYVSFSVPEKHLAEIKRRLAGGRLPVTATIPGEGQFAATGTLSFIDNAVDSSTGTIRLKATFDNQGRQLWPGQFMNVSLRLSTQENAVVIPSQAVQTGQSGYYAYVVKPDMRAELRPIVPGNQAGGETVIEKGLEVGETIVTDGQLRLFPDARVEVKKP